MTEFRKGDQVAYVPRHAQIPAEGHWEWDPKHPYVEFGFVVRQRGQTVFCRFWWQGRPGELRTAANSEGTPASCLVRHESVSDAKVQETLARIEAESQ